MSTGAAGYGTTCEPDALTTFLTSNSLSNMFSMCMGTPVQPPFYPHYLTLILTLIFTRILRHSFTAAHLPRIQLVVSSLHEYDVS